MVKIYFIYADNCECCKGALETIERAILKCEKISCEIIKFHYDTKAAVSIAINRKIDDLPGFCIGEDVYVGKEYSEERIVKSIRKAFDNE